MRSCGFCDALQMVPQVAGGLFLHYRPSVATSTLMSLNKTTALVDGTALPPNPRQITFTSPRQRSVVEEPHPTPCPGNPFGSNFQMPN
jgi:hypothetical protein